MFNIQGILKEIIYEAQILEYEDSKRIYPKFFSKKYQVLWSLNTGMKKSKKGDKSGLSLEGAVRTLAMMIEDWLKHIELVLPQIS